MKKQSLAFAGAFFFALGGNCLGFSLIFRLTDWFSFTAGQIGIFMALGSFAYFLGCNLYHRFGSLFEPVKIFPAAAVLACAASIPLSFIRVIGVVYVAYWLIQIGAGCFWPPVMSWLTAGLDEKNISKTMAAFNRSWMSACMVGPLIAGILYNRNSTLNFILIIFSYSTALFLLFLLRFFLKKNDGRNESKTGGPVVKAPGVGADVSAGERRFSPASRTIDVRLNTYRYRGWISGACSAMFVGILANIVPLHIRDGLGYTEQSAGLLLFIRCAAGLLGFTLLARFSAWHFNRKWFIIVQAGIMACTLTLMLSGSALYLYFVVVVVYGLCNSASYNNSMFYSSITGKNPKKNLALHEIFMSVGTAAGSAGGGFFYQHFGFTGACMALLAVLGLGMFVFVFVGRKEA